MTMPGIIHRQYQQTFVTSMLDEDFSKRIIHLDDKIDFDSAVAIEKQISYLNVQDPEKEIIIKITSPGGIVQAGMVVVDAIRMSKAPITCVAVGFVASMAAIIFAVGNKRIVYPSATIMIHDPLTKGISGSALEIQEQSQNLMAVRKLTARILAERCHKQIKEIYKATERSTYFSAKQAIEFGIADEIADRLY